MSTKSIFDDTSNPNEINVDSYYYINMSNLNTDKRCENITTLLNITNKQDILMLGLNNNIRFYGNTSSKNTLNFLIFVFSMAHIFITYTILCYMKFFSKTRYPHIEVRNFTITTLIYLGIFLQVMAGPYLYIVFLPSYWYFIFSLPVVPLLVFPGVYRLVEYLLTFVFHRACADVSIDSVDDDASSVSSATNPLSGNTSILLISTESSQQQQDGFDQGKINNHENSKNSNGKLFTLQRTMSTRKRAHKDDDFLSVIKSARKVTFKSLWQRIDGVDVVAKDKNSENGQIVPIVTATNSKNSVTSNTTNAVADNQILGPASIDDISAGRPSTNSFNEAALANDATNKTLSQQQNGDRKSKQHDGISLDKINVVVVPTNETRHSKRVSNLSATSNYTTMSSTKEKISRDMLRVLKFLSSWKMVVIGLTLLSAPFITLLFANLLAIPSLYPPANCYGALGFSFNSAFLISYSATGIIVAALLGYRVRKFPDPFGIIWETRMYYMLGGTTLLVGYVLSIQTKIHENEKFSFKWITTLGGQIGVFFIGSIQIYIAWREQRKLKPAGNIDINHINENYSQHGHHPERRETAVITPARMMQLLNTSKESAAFEEYLVGEFAVENMRFYSECKKWEVQYHTMTAQTRKARAKKILSLFVEDGSLFMVNIPHQLREELIKTFDEKQENLPIDVFHKTQKEMLGILYGSFQRFMKSEAASSLNSS